MPKRFVYKRGQRLRPQQKLVGRSSRWGNPFPVARVFDPGKPPRLVKHYAQKWGVSVQSLVCETPKQAVERFRQALLKGDLDYSFEDVRRELEGKDLGCPCGSEDCHAEVLLDTANQV